MANYFGDEKTYAASMKFKELLIATSEDIVCIAPADNWNREAVATQNDWYMSHFR